MEPQGDLQAASTYINNVLLARGLVKSGRPIDFANPENEEGGTPNTMARIINLVNDLVLRRDREAEHRENLATTIRTLRTEDSHKTVEIEKLQTKTSELSRSLALAEAQERTFKTNMASGEGTIRGLKEQVQRMKTTVQQVRSQCANDIRKRDLELQKLKAHLADRQRGKRDGLGVTTININPAASQTSRRYLAGGEGVHDPGYSLKQETNEFLTQLCQTLSDENDSLISLARNTVYTLKELQGLSAEEEAVEHGYSTSTAQRSTHGPAVTSLPASCEELSGEMDQVLEHLRTLLTNPSFVPLEEVEVRDEEIKRLREGWEKMESRWRQAVTMMDGWHKRIAHGGGSIRAEELRMGLKLDVQVDARQSRVKDNDVAMHSPIYEDQEDEEIEAEEEPAEEPSHEDTAPPEELRPSRALKERTDNTASRKEVSFSENKGKPSKRQEEDDTMPIKAHQSDAVTRRPSRKRVEPKGPRPAPTRLSVPQKLAAAESEARAAEQARREQESRKRSRWVAHNPKSALVHEPFTPKPFNEQSDIEVQITHCGICGTDVHTIRSGWAPSDYPCVVGHEIIGTTTRIGSQIPSSGLHGIKAGDRVGIGAQSSSCLKPDCEACADNEESYCPHMVATYNSRYPDGSKAYGGYADYWRGPAHFVFKIPENLSSAEAAPLLCGGVTVYAPLKRFGTRDLTGKRVGIVGIGGLGHMGLLFARAMGAASVVAISRSSAKKSDAVGALSEGKLGADTFIATGEDKSWAKTHSRTLDIIICTVSGENMPLAGYLRLLKRNGVFVQVGAPEDPLPPLRAFSLIQKGVLVTGSSIGSPNDIRDMLELASQRGVRPWVERKDMEGVNRALAEMHEGKARYRFVLENAETKDKSRL
ncbi:Afadin and alpha-actinin-binding-domain-containing protein [Aspergillus unguis]